MRQISYTVAILALVFSGCVNGPAVDAGFDSGGPLDAGPPDPCSEEAIAREAHANCTTLWCCERTPPECPYGTCNACEWMEARTLRESCAGRDH